MTHRYTGALGRRLEGNLPRAHEVQGTARLLVQQCLNEIGHRGGWGQACRQLALRDGTIVKAIVLQHQRGFEPIVRVEVFAPQGEKTYDTGWQYIFLGAVWQPEGLVVSPVSAEAPYGYGFPKRDGVTGERINPPWGTKIEAEEDVCRIQCLFNKFANNKYLDHPDYIKGLEAWFSRLPDNPRLRDHVDDPVPESGLPFYRYWHFCYGPRTAPEFSNEYWEQNRHEYIDEPGLNIQFSAATPYIPYKTEGEADARQPLVRQFSPDERWAAIYEEPTDQWYCHWGEENLYENRAFESVFQECNRLRAAAGEQPIIRHIRGRPSGAWLTTLEIQRAQVQFHNNEDLYRPGYGQVRQRWLGCGFLDPSGMGENLLTCPIDDLNSSDAGKAINAYWERSPPHYANIIHASGSSPKYNTSLDVGGALQVSITATGYPYPNEYDPPISGTAYAQWFMRGAENDMWVWAGLIHNETAFGKVSIRVRESWLGSSAIRRYRYLLFFGGRAFYVGNVLNDGDNNDVILGASAFLGDDGRMWFRVIVMAAGEGAGFKCLIAPLSNVSDDMEWVEDAYLPLSTITSSPHVYARTAASFSFDGSAAVFTIHHWVDTTTTFWFPDDPDDPDPVRNTIGTSIVWYEDGAFTVNSVDLPKVTFDHKTRVEDERIYCTEYTQRCSGDYIAYAFFDANDEPQYITYTVNLDCSQYEDADSVFIAKDVLTFPSGRTLPITNFDLVAGFPRDDTECFTTAILYLDPRHEDVVYAKIILRRETTNIFASLEFWYNDVRLRTYPEEWVAGGYHYPEARIKSFRLTTSTPIHERDGWESLESAKNRLRWIYDIGRIRTSLYDGTIYPFPPQRSDSTPIAFCTNLPDVAYDIHKPCVGEHPISTTPRTGVDTYCFSTNSPPTYAWSYDAGIPVTIYNPTTRIADGVICEFARYQDRVVLDIFFKQLHGVRLRDAEGNVNPDGEHIIWANFPLDEEVGIGELIGVMPLGVI